MGKVARIAAGLWLLWPGALRSALGAGSEHGVDVRPGLRLALAANKLVLGQDRETRLRITAPREVTADQLTVRASAGEVIALQREAAGQFSATYRAPGAFHPQVAIIAAVAETEGRLLVGQVALPLWGQGDADVRTQPLSAVRVLIGEQTFGPVKADRLGRAKVKVIVPPGTRYGWDGRRKVDLKVPPLRRLFARVLPDRFVGVTSKRVALLLFATDEKGQLSGAVQPEVQGVTAAQPRALGRGAFATVLDMEAGKPGIVTVRSTLPGVSGGEALVSIRRLVGPPARLSLTTEGTTVGSAPMPLHVRVEDALGSAVDAEGIEVIPSAGTAQRVQRRGPGDYATVFVPPPEGTGRVTFKLRATAAGGLAGAAEVTVRYPAPPVRRGLRPLWFWTSLGAGGALIASGIVTRAVALDKSNEYKDPATTIPRRRELKDVGEPLTTYSTVALAVGAAVVAGAAALWFFTDFGGGRGEAGAGSAALVPLSGGAQVLLLREF